MSEKFLIQSPEVLYPNQSLTTVDHTDIERFKHSAAQNHRKRIRLCAHSSPEERLHEMLIVHERGAYVRPHSHPGKSESTHIIEGVVDVVMFEDDGKIAEILRMGDYASGRIFYYRLSASVFHTLIIHSKHLVFHETTNGPFNHRDTIFAPWSPEETDVDGVRLFMSALHENCRLFSHDNSRIPL